MMLWGHFLQEKTENAQFFTWSLEQLKENMMRGFKDPHQSEPGSAESFHSNKQKMFFCTKLENIPSYPDIRPQQQQLWVSVSQEIQFQDKTENFK